MTAAQVAKSCGNSRLAARLTELETRVGSGCSQDLTSSSSSSWGPGGGTGVAAVAATPTSKKRVLDTMLEGEDGHSESELHLHRGGARRAVRPVTQEISLPGLLPPHQVWASKAVIQFLTDNPSCTLLAAVLLLGSIIG